MMKTPSVSLLTILFLTTPAFASAAKDVAMIRSLLPAGFDIAQIQAGVLRGEPTENALKLGKANYLIRDINEDGKKDVLVILEKNPTLVDYSGQTPVSCSAYNGFPCAIQYGPRAMSLYYGQTDGSFALAFTNDQMVLAGDDGGVFGDPLQGLSSNKRGAVSLSVYGGSAWRWAYTDVMQFRKGDFFLVGQESYEGWVGDGRSHTLSTNFITGEVMETIQKDGNAPIVKRRYKVAVKKLVRVSDYAGIFASRAP